MSESQSAPVIDLDSRPDAAWLAEVEGEIDDVDVVLKCLARNTDTICETCRGLDAEGDLSARPVLDRCASNKQP